MSGESKMLNTETSLMNFNMLGACQVNVKCSKIETGLMNY